MGFQVGSQIDPRLMAVDYSPLIRSGEIAAESISNMGRDIGSAIGSYTEKKKESKSFEQAVKGSLAMGEVLMKNLPNEQANTISEYIATLGLGNPDVPMSQQYQASQELSRSLISMIDSVKGDDVTSMNVPGGTVIMQGGEVIKVISTDSPTMNFGGTDNFTGATPEEIVARRAQLRGNQ
jgi:hypothetical protein